MDYCIERSKVSELLSYLFNKEQFTRDLRGHTVEVIEKTHKCIVETIISQINGVLYFSKNEFVLRVANSL